MLCDLCSNRQKFNNLYLHTLPAVKIALFQLEHQGSFITRKISKLLGQIKANSWECASLDL